MLIRLVIGVLCSLALSGAASSAQAHYYDGCRKAKCKKHVHRTSSSFEHLQRIKRCESGGNYRAVSSGGHYRGAYQFDYRTWASVGGTGDPAKASRVEQNYRATVLYARRGAQPWPVCGR